MLKKKKKKNMMRERQKIFKGIQLRVRLITTQVFCTQNVYCTKFEIEVSVCREVSWQRPLGLWFYLFHLVCSVR